MGRNKRKEIKRKKQKNLVVKSATCDERKSEKRLESQCLDSDKEQRRAARLGTIVALIAVVGAICGYLFKMIMSSINVWPQEGILYWYMQILFLMALSAAVIIVIDTVNYVVTDLKRYNIAAVDYKENDIKSDEKYFELLYSVKTYLFVLIVVLLMLLPMSAWYREGIERYVSFTCIAVLTIVWLMVLLMYVRKKKGNGLLKTVLSTCRRVGRLIVVALLCYLLCVSFATQTEAKIKIIYMKNGCVEICNMSSCEYEGMEMELYDAKMELISSETIELEELLLAREKLHIIDEIDGKKIGEGVALDAEIMHWKYNVDMENFDITDGTYALQITVSQEGKKVVLINMFRVEGDDYIFATDMVEKSY